jgi:signal transduction histidine kinase/ActR/RegA family two-component response regulator
MLGNTKNRRYLIGLGLGTATMALAMAVLLVFEISQKQTIRAANDMRSDSVIALAFQCEREFLRFRSRVDVAVHSGTPLDVDDLALRFDIFQSRLTLLRDNPSISMLVGQPEYVALLPELEKMVRQTEAVLAKKPVVTAELAGLLGTLNSLGPNVQALTVVATSEVSHRLEHQDATMLEQNDLIIALTVLQLLLLMVAAAALVIWQRRQESERLALEALNVELKDARFKAEAASRSKSQFLANMSHELRTPFNGMLGMMQLLESTALDASQRDFIATAQSSAKHLLSLLNDILDVSALESGNFKLTTAPTDVRQVFNDVQSLLEPQATSKGVRLVSLAPNNVLPWAEVDAKRLKQILFNLVGNAIKFTEQGAVTVTAQVNPLGHSAAELVCEVTDTGIGMDASSLEKLFQRFYQVDAGANRKFGGTGLGLEISQSLAELMGGKITVRSQLGQGSTFTLRIPLALCPSGANRFSPSEYSAVPPVVAAQANPVGNGSKQVSVLVVEDHAINRKLVGMLLGRMGCAVTFCEDGQQAVDPVQTQAFDAILMDVNMPVMDGLTATRQIRAMGGAMAAVPIIVFTADVMNEAKERASAAGANDFLPKPVQIGDLRATLQKYVSAELNN